MTLISPGVAGGCRTCAACPDSSSGTSVFEYNKQNKTSNALTIATLLCSIGATQSFWQRGSDLPKNRCRKYRQKVSTRRLSNATTQRQAFFDVVVSNTYSR